LVIDKEEYYEMAKKLECHHSLFYKFWEMGVPVFSNEHATAWVKFNKEGEFLNYYFNPDFWERITPYERLFVICHESLHILLKHGLRTKDAEDPEATNMALDVVVNHMLVSAFGFERSLLTSAIEDGGKPMKDASCWVDTVFEGKVSDVYKGKAFEYYYNLIDKFPECKAPKNGGKGNPKGDGVPQPIDCHDYLSGLEDCIDEMVEDAMGNFSDKEKRDLANKIEEEFDGLKDAFGELAGSMPGGLDHHVGAAPPKRKKKWETVIKNWTAKVIKMIDKQEEQWARLNRRFACLDSDFMLPTEMEIETRGKEKDKIEVWFFQDTSGSCWHLKDRLFKAAESLPPEKFNVRFYCFDGKVFEADIKERKLYGGGGTKFSIIEEYIQNTIKKENVDYPLAVWVLTDGWGNEVSPKVPKNWYWFLTEYSSKNYIPKESKTFNLSDYE
jgi:predicted metal-dependent peptidase